MHSARLRQQVPGLLLAGLALVALSVNTPAAAKQAQQPERRVEQRPAQRPEQRPEPKREERHEARHGHEAHQNHPVSPS